MTGTDMVFAQASLHDRYRWAEAIASAGDLVPKGFRNPNGTGNPAKVLLAVETGNMLGLHPMAALSGIHVIQGRPTLSAALMTALVHRAGHTIRVRIDGTYEAQNLRATATLIRRDDPANPFTSTWTLDRAKRAGLLDKDTWKAYPESMLKARAVSEVARDGASDVLLGVLYTAEELDADIDEDGAPVVDPGTGEVIEDAEVVTEPTTPTPPAYDAELGDQWAVRLNDATTLDDLRHVWDDAKAAHATRVWIDDPDKVPNPHTVESYKNARKQDLQTEKSPAA